MSWTAPRTWSVGETLTAALMNQQMRDNLGALAPVGKYEFFLRAPTTVETVIENAYLEANGAAVSRATYASLSSLASGLGYPFGNGDGSTTFNVPDGRGRDLVAAAGTGGHADMALGATEGVALASRRQKHKHTFGHPTVNSHNHGGGVHNHVIGVFQHQYGTGAPTATTKDFASTPNATVSTDNSGTIIGSEAPGTSGGTVGPQSGSEPTDASAYLVAGVWAIKF